ncbi:hypothetical protein BpHYR1_025319 [Brachionus plicatilis]|uniref:Uncharacterized protein n=1 Tax=Brachionus plicatilis TaxID=10195 RepID=A0A3M7PMG7_BRAPC|nr:hypothetical protein BpHYR1_025319 [Brachionus plicatilis]
MNLTIEKKFHSFVLFLSGNLVHLANAEILFESDSLPLMLELICQNKVVKLLAVFLDPVLFVLNREIDKKN